MALAASIKNPHWDPLDLFDEPGVPPVYKDEDPVHKDDEKDLCLRPVEPFGVAWLFDDGIEPPVYFYPDQGICLWPISGLFDRDSLSLDPVTLGPLPANPLSLDPGPAV